MQPPCCALFGIKKNVWNAIMPTYRAPKKTWEKRRTSIPGDSLLLIAEFRAGGDPCGCPGRLPLCGSARRASRAPRPGGISPCERRDRAPPRFPCSPGPARPAEARPARAASLPLPPAPRWPAPRWRSPARSPPHRLPPPRSRARSPDLPSPAPPAGVASPGRRRRGRRAASRETREESLDVRHRDGERDTGHDHRRHADHPTLSIADRAPRIPRRQTHIGLDPDERAVPVQSVAAGQRAHGLEHAHADRVPHPERMAHREDQGAGPQGVRIARDGRRHAGPDGRRGRSVRPAVRLPGLRGGPSVRGEGRGQRGRAPGREPSAPRLRTERERLVRLDPGRCAFGAGEFGGPGRRCSGSGDRRGGDGRVRYRARRPGAGRRAIPLGSHVKLRVYLDVADPVTRRRMAALVKADPEIALVAGVEEADVVVSERVIATAAPTTVPRDGAALTPRELDVLRLVALGLGNKEIAAELDLSAHTVKYHLASVLAKLGVRSRTEAVSRGIRTGLLPL